MIKGEAARQCGRLEEIVKSVLKVCAIKGKEK